MSDQRTVGDVLEARDTVSLVTGDLHARPMTVQTVEHSTVWFLTDRTADWVGRLLDDDRVCITRADDDDGEWASLTGDATVVHDRDRVRQLWDVVELAWFDGPEDEDLVALSVEVGDGEWWESSGGRVGQAVAILRAMVDDDADAGSRGDVTA